MKNLNLNITDFSSYKVLYELTKKRSSHAIMLATDEPDEWLITVIEYKKKTGEVLHAPMIIKPDLELRLSSLFKQGYELKK